MNPNEAAIYVLAGIGVLGLIYFAQQQTGDQIVPAIQSDEMVEGLGFQASMRINAGTPLDTSWENHGWCPGYDPSPAPQPVTQSKVRYPAVPGGNLSTVMHKGWSSCINSAPAGNTWMVAPPEAAVI
jgi:hypothetical protein